MKISYVIGVVLMAMSAGTFAASNNAANGTAQSQAGAGATAATGAITFNSNSNQHRHSSVDTTPTLYAPPSMFGGANNCGQSDTLAVGVTGFGIGGSHATESLDCNSREDTSIAYKLGYKKVADLRFFCFGADSNRKAYEAAGFKCPQDSTAKGLQGAPTTQVVYKSQPQVQPNTVDMKDISKTNQQLRKQHSYYGTDPIIMRRYGITQ